MNLQFWRSKEFSDISFLDLITRTFGQTFSTVTEARTWLSNNGYFTSYPDIVDDGLVISLDAQNISSYRGEPTTNLNLDILHSTRNNGDTIGSSVWGGDTGYGEFLTDTNINSLQDSLMYINHNTSDPAGTGGVYNDFSQGYTLTNGVTYTRSWYMKSDIEQSISGHICSCNRSSDNTYIVGPNLSVTTEWKRYSYTFIYGGPTSSDWHFRHINYNTSVVSISSVQLEEKEYATNIVDDSRGTTCATGGGWCDLTSNDYNLTLTNSPTYNSDGYLSFDGITNYCTFDSVYSFSTGNGTDYSFEIWFKMKTLPTVQYGSNGHIWGGENGNNVVIYLNPESGGTSKGVMVYDDSRYYADMMTNGGFLADTWAQWVIVGDGTINTVTHYINGSLDKENGVVMSGQEVKTWSGTRIAYDSRWVTYSELDISIMRQYNRQVTASEVLQSFNSQKLRFGL